MAKTYTKQITADQQKVIDYFTKEDGCLSKKMSDEEYKAMIQQKLEKYSEEYALEQLGIEKEQVDLINPVCFHGYMYDNAYRRLGKDNIYHASRYQVSRFFFSENQVYFFQITFSMDETKEAVSTQEYFYKDITSFSTASTSKEYRVLVKENGCLSSKNVEIQNDINTQSFYITVPGDKLSCSLNATTNVQAAIKGMQSLLREKKNQ